MDAEDKTSIAERPNIQELLSSMQKSNQQAGGNAPAAPVQEKEDRTEIMSGSELPDFASLFGGQANEGNDATVEMSNPLFSGNRDFGLPAKPAGPAQGAFVEDDLATQEINNDVIQQSIQHVQNQMRVGAPAEEDDPRTEIVDPPNLDAMHAPRPSRPSQPSQHHLAANTGPTPPPGSGARSSSSSGPMGQGLSGGNSSPFGATPAPIGGSPAGGGGANPGHEGPWKLQTNFGLTYEFADNKSLRNWLDSRDELEGYKLSADGNDFLPLNEWPQVQKNSPRSSANRNMASGGNRTLGGMAPAGGGGSAPAPPPRRSGSIPGSPFTTANPAVTGPPVAGTTQKEKINPNESYKPPKRDSSIANIALWGVFGLLVVAALALALHLGDVITLPGLDGGSSEAPEEVNRFPQAAPAAAGGVVDEERSNEEAEARARRNREEVNRMIRSAEEDIETNRLSSALERLERAQALDPNRIQLFDLKADVHEKLGQTDRAEQMRQRAQELRAGAPVRE